MIEGSSVQEHGVKMLSLVEKLKDLKANLEKETYIDVILQSLPPSFDSFIVNYNMNGLDKDLHELINMLVQYEATIVKSASSILVGEASTSKAKGKGAGRWRRKKGKTESTTASAQSAPVAPLVWAKERGKRFDSHGLQKMFAFITVKRGIGRGSVLNSSLRQNQLLQALRALLLPRWVWQRKEEAVRQSWIANDVCIYCREKGHWKRECPKLLSNQGGVQE
ncbi:UNVERIFIED_CONTAM: hypothetical protein Slati_2986200 [Sesamum latifolium]|uniref:CCHC-type domain-containing protein n=1 Tax=Sesamum latifolium TaxID=2727402 RepID=A0AAW2VGM0_9LAMI